MGISRSRTNDEHLPPQQRRRAVVLLLATGLVRMIGPEKPPEKSAESPEKALGLPGEPRPCVPSGLQTRRFWLSRGEHGSKRVLNEARWRGLWACDQSEDLPKMKCCGGEAACGCRRGWMARDLETQAGM